MDICLLGPVRVRGPGGGDVDIAGRRLRALLALMALEAPSVVSTERILDALWGRDESSSKSALHAAISRLRSDLGETVIETVPGGYRLGLPVSHIDIDRFRRHAARGGQLLTLGHPGPAAEGFRQALAQWEGPPLVDIDLPFAEEARRRLEEERLSVVERLMEAELAAGNHQIVVGELSGLVSSFPFREKLWGQLMLALYRSGRQAEALRTYSELRTLLADELGIDPSKDIVDLEERILLHDPTLDDHPDTGRPVEWPDEAEVVSFPAGSVIVEEGSAAGTVYWIEDGRAEVVKTTSDGEMVVLAELGPGRYFGELASLLGTGRTASVRALTPVTVSLHSVESFRARLGAERAKDETDPVPVDNVRDLIAAGQYMHAYDVAITTVQHGSADPEVRYLAVLALARAGATDQARRRYASLGLATIDPSTVTRRLAEDIVGVDARLDKDMALRHTGPERERWARRSAERYQEGFEEYRAAYLAVNAATMWLTAGDVDAAERMARAAFDTAPGDDYWSAATRAEAALVLGDIEAAKAALASAASAAGATNAARASTLSQLKRVCELTHVDRAILAPIANPAVVHFCGHRILPEGQQGGFTADDEERVATELSEVFERSNVGFGFGSLAAGADILAAEALLERGARLSVVLPFDREEFVRTSVAPAGPEWVARFERCLGAADRVTMATNSEYLDDPALFDFCARIAMGDAVMRARFLQAEVRQVAVWDGVQTGGVAGTAADVTTWSASGNPGTIIRVAEHPGRGAASRPKRRIRGILFADFAGFSTLSDAGVLRFQEEVIGALSHVIDPYRAEMLSGRTWGDGLNLVFEDVGTAAECALALREAVAEMELGSKGLGSIRGIRIAAHATPVFDGWDPIAGNRLFFGAGVTETARIEPRTPEGEIYTTHAFAALAVLTPNRSFDTQYVGTLPTAKGFGSMPLFVLRRSEG